jgi:glutamate racemase
MKVQIISQNESKEDYQDRINKRLGELSTRYKNIKIIPCNTATGTYVYREVMIICEE